jgi:isopenicillin-N epimerase
MSPFSALWQLDPEIAFLNHGSFGACPSAVMQVQGQWRERLEREPVRFFLRELDSALAEARESLARLVGADADDLAFVTNSTTGVNTVLRSLSLSPKDELLTTNHVYGACNNALEFTAQQRGARVVMAEVPFPLTSADEVVEAVLRHVTPRTKLLLIDHVTSPTALIFPVQRLVSELAARGVDTLVDGAHAPGMLALDLRALGAAYYTANCHKWLCAPKGSAFLHVRRDRQRQIRPLVISHGAASPRADRSRFRQEMDWTGTHDPSPYLSVPAAIQFLEQLLPGGLPALMMHNRELMLRARAALLQELGIDAPAPADMLGSMVTVPLPRATLRPVRASALEPLQDDLFEHHRIEAPVFRWPSGGAQHLRVTAHAYNSWRDYERLLAALRTLFF